MDEAKFTKEMAVADAREITRLQRQLSEQQAAFERDLAEAIDQRDSAEESLQDTHLALGGDGEWVGKMPPELPPNSGDLRLDVPALAAEKQAEIERLRGLLREATGYVDSQHDADPHPETEKWMIDANAALRDS